LLKDLKNYPKSRERFQSILERFPTAGVADQAGYYYAITYYMEDRCEETVAGFEDLIKRYSESVWIPEAYYHIGLCKERLNRVSEAENNFRYVIDQFPTTLWARRAREKLAQPPVVETGALFTQAVSYFNRDQCKEVKALVQRLRTEQTDFKEMDQAIALDALCFYKEGNYEETINRYRGLAEKYPKSRLAPEAYYHIALSSQRLQRFDEAKRNYERVVKRFPETEWARHSSEALKNLK
jgi:TolA-binding protein